MMVEASGQVRPSRVTTSKPTLSPALLTSPAKRTMKHWSLKSNTKLYKSSNGRGREREMLTSVETLNLEGGVGGFEGLEHSHDQGAFSYTLMKITIKSMNENHSE